MTMMISSMAASLAVTAAFTLGVPSISDSYGWVCGYLDEHPTFFGVLGLSGEVSRRNLNEATAPGSILVEVRNNCPRHAALLDANLDFVF